MATHSSIFFFFFKLFTAGWVLVVALGLFSSCGLGLSCSAACGIFSSQTRDRTCVP